MVGVQCSQPATQYLAGPWYPGGLRYVCLATKQWSIQGEGRPCHPFNATVVTEERVLLDS